LTEAAIAGSYSATQQQCIGPQTTAARKQDAGRAKPPTASEDRASNWKVANETTVTHHSVFFVQDHFWGDPAVRSGSAGPVREGQAARDELFAEAEVRYDHSLLGQVVGDRYEDVGRFHITMDCTTNKKRT